MTSPRAASDGPQGRRYAVTLDDGTEARLPGANTAMSAIDKPGLTTWKMKLVAFGIANDPDRLELAKSWETCWQAVRACLDESSYEADLGNAVHAVTAAIDVGDDTDWSRLIPPTVHVEDVMPYVEQWKRCKSDHRIELLAVEQSVYNGTYKYAGTLDRVARVPALKLDEPVIGDIKTGKEVWPDVAMQLVAYARAEGIIDGDKRARPLLYPMPSLDIGVVFHLTPASYAVIPMDLTDAWFAFLSAAACFRWIAEDSREAVLPALGLPEEQWPW